MLYDSDLYIATPLYGAMIKTRDYVSEACSAVSEAAEKAGLRPHELAVELRLLPSPAGLKVTATGYYAAQQDGTWNFRHVTEQSTALSYADATLIAMTLDPEEILDDPNSPAAWIDDVREDDLGANYFVTGVGAWIFDLFDLHGMNEDIALYMSDREESEFLEDFTAETLIRDYLGPNPGDPFSPYEARDAVWDWDNNVMFIVPQDGNLSDDMACNLAPLGDRLLQEEMARQNLAKVHDGLIHFARAGLAGEQDLSFYRDQTVERLKAIAESGDPVADDTSPLWRDPDKWTENDVRWKREAYDSTLGLNAATT